MPDIFYDDTVKGITLILPVTYASLRAQREDFPLNRMRRFDETHIQQREKEGKRIKWIHKLVPPTPQSAHLSPDHSDRYIIKGKCIRQCT